MLDGAFGPAPQDFFLLGNANLDPADGEGLRDVMETLLSDPRVQDRRPSSEVARLAPSPGQAGDPALHTADWP